MLSVEKNTKENICHEKKVTVQPSTVTRDLFRSSMFIEGMLEMGVEGWVIEIKIF